MSVPQEQTTLRFSWRVLDLCSTGSRAGSAPRTARFSAALQREDRIRRRRSLEASESRRVRRETPDRKRRKTRTSTPASGLARAVDHLARAGWKGAPDAIPASLAAQARPGVRYARSSPSLSPPKSSPAGLHSSVPPPLREFIDLALTSRPESFLQAFAAATVRSTFHSFDTKMTAC